MNNKYKISVLAFTISALSACGGGDNSADEIVNDAKKSTLITTQKLTSGDSNCANGGYGITAGYDENENNTLDTEEQLSFKYICNDGSQTTDSEGEEIFSEAMVAVAMIAKEDEDCSTGGQKVSLGIDDNDNGNLDESEITDSILMCNTGALKAPDAIINALTTSASIVAPSSNIVIEATISNLANDDVLVWTDEEGNELQPQDVNMSNILEVKVGASKGSETYYLYIEQSDDQGGITLQKKQIQITIGQAASETQAVALDTKQVYLPDGYSVTPVTGDISGTVMYADPIEAEAQTYSTRAAIPTPDDTELVGFVAERSAMSQGSDTTSLLDGMLNAYYAAYNPSSLSQFSKTVLENGDISASYNISLRSGLKPTELLENLMSQIAVNVVGGSIDSLVPASTETEAENYQFDIVLNYDSENDNAVLTSTLVAKDKVANYSGLITSTTSESIISDLTSTLELQNDTFTATEQTTSKADFLFVIDNSGSMSDEQNAISALTKSFTNTVTNAGLDFMVATITTDSSELRGNGFTSDVEQIEQDLLPGTWGSGNERGIYYSEQALTTDTGSVLIAGYPRENATLSVIIMSDERSHYSYYYSSGEFDTADNLFVTNGYRVYAVVRPSDANDSQYDDLATATLGATLNIEEISEYDNFMDTVANNAGALSAGYELSTANTDNQILSSSIAVEVDGVEVARDTSDGWQYYPQSESIVFTGSEIPSAGSAITVSYQYVAN